MKLPRSPLAIAGLVCAVLPFALLAGGLTLTSATDVVIFAIACMALNVLVGHTGLVSFGHGAWFGLGAYAAALAQRHWFPASVLWPALFALGFLLVASVLIGFLVLRRRGVYFSLLTLAFSALTYAVAFRWTAFTGGENGLGGVTRATWLGVDLENPWVYYAIVATLGLLVVHALARFHASPIGSVLLAIRENEQRAQFVGYATQRYKQIAYAASATLTGFAGVLFAFHHRFASADPTSISSSGELLAMVIIGGMRSLLGPALGALFYILFREYLSIWTPNWLLFFGLLFVAFVVFSPTGLVGVWRRLTEPMRPAASRLPRWRVARSSMDYRCRRSFADRASCRDRARSQGSGEGVRRYSRRRGSKHRGGRSHAARVDRTRWRRQDDAVQSGFRNVHARSRPRRARWPRHHRRTTAPHRRGRTVEVVSGHQSVSGAFGRGEPAACRAGRRPVPFRRLDADDGDRAGAETYARADRLSRPDRHRTGRSRRAFLRRPATSRHGPGARLGAARPATRRASRRARRRRA